MENFTFYALLVSKKRTVIDWRTVIDSLKILLFENDLFKRFFIDKGSYLRKDDR